MSAAAPDALADGVLAGSRRALARAITLIESTLPDHRARASALLDRLLPHAGRATRLGISGVPGVGKSTFVEALGCRAIQDGRRVAVLAVDPSSPVAGGSILGDKTRMAGLARDAAAFVRPTPSGGALGGVARRTQETMILCEAAGYDLIVVETVGVGQSEVAVAGMVDLFLLLLAPGAGDELQGIKKGIVEMADIVVVNKADGDLLAAAQRAEADYRSALSLLRRTHPDWTVPVLALSSFDPAGIGRAWAEIAAFHRVMAGNGAIAARRARQARAWMWSEIGDGLMAHFRASPGVAEQLADLENRVESGLTAPATAARMLLDAFLDTARGRG